MDRSDFFQATDKVLKRVIFIVLRMNMKILGSVQNDDNQKSHPLEDYFVINTWITDNIYNIKGKWITITKIY